jgi:hypothetical protein
MTNLVRQSLLGTTRRHILLGSLGAAVAAISPAAVVADQQGSSQQYGNGRSTNEIEGASCADYHMDAPRPFCRHGRTVAHLQ